MLAKVSQLILIAKREPHQKAWRRGSVSVRKKVEASWICRKPWSVRAGILDIFCVLLVAKDRVADFCAVITWMVMAGCDQLKKRVLLTKLITCDFSAQNQHIRRKLTSSSLALWIWLLSNLCFDIHRISGWLVQFHLYDLHPIPDQIQWKAFQYFFIWEIGSFFG